ncbi:HpcH/HpaI aldolase/citrate lyase family protein [Sphingopyxis sp.]|uniref:HpcH/HpaI aldolase/citrate lyase family protein n=1 Tax=Sphingopyxis sp. TaxID=1908224 RepID=UPI003D0DDFFA
MLFVPGDSERKFAKAAAIGADALILDLEDAVAPSMKVAARALVAELIAQNRTRDWAFFVRVNPFDTGMTFDDMAAVVKPGLDGLLIPKANGADDIARIAAELDRLEAATGMANGSVKIAVVATETPKAMFNLGSYTPPHPRLIALTWGAEDLAAAIGATANKEADGSWTFPYQVARTHCLYAAAAAEVAPLDTLYADFRDADGLEADCRRSRRDGFTGRIAIHPDQVAVINRCYAPSADEIAEAQKIVDAFAAQPDAGTLGIDGKMYDIPHLKAAQKTLASA